MSDRRRSRLARQGRDDAAFIAEQIKTSYDPRDKPTVDTRESGEEAQCGPGQMQARGKE